MEKPVLLILSFSPIYRDARVLKQVSLFKDNYRVVTCSYGPEPAGVDEHIQIPESESISYMNGRFITLKWYKRVYWETPAVAWALKTLRGKSFDVVLANDFDAVPVALAIRPRYGVHADLHEYSPSQFEHDEAWARRIRPYREWVCRKYLTRADSWTTVCQGLSDKYSEMFGFRSEVVTNATPYADLVATPVQEPIRLVHHGGASPARGLDVMVEAVMASRRDLVFDLFLQDVGGNEIERLRELAKDDSRINVLNAIPYGELISRLNSYDIGLSIIQPKTFNLLHALPNKLFDYVQARTAILTGPSPEMAAVVKDNELGLVLKDFQAKTLTRAIDAFELDQVSTWKQNSDSVAWQLSAESQNVGWERPIDALFSRSA